MLHYPTPSILRFQTIVLARLIFLKGLFFYKKLSYSLGYHSRQAIVLVRLSFSSGYFFIVLVRLTFSKSIVLYELSLSSSYCSVGPYRQAVVVVRLLLSSGYFSRLISVLLRIW